MSHNMFLLIAVYSYVFIVIFEIETKYIDDGQIMLGEKNDQCGLRAVFIINVGYNI